MVFQRAYYRATVSNFVRLRSQYLKHKFRLHLRQLGKIITTQYVQVALSRRQMDLLRLSERVKKRQLLLGRANHILLGHHHQHGRRTHIFHDPMRLPHDDIVIALQSRSILMSRGAPTFCIDHVIEFFLVGADTHTSGILAFLRQDGEESGFVARGLRFTILHTCRKHTRKFGRGELEIKQWADGDAAFGAFVERRGAEGDCGGERHAPEGNGVRVNDREGAEESECVGVVRNLLDGVDIVARGAIAEAEAARVVDEGCNVRKLVLLRHFRDEHLFDAIKLYAIDEPLVLDLCGGFKEVLMLIHDSLKQKEGVV